MCHRPGQKSAKKEIILTPEKAFFGNFDFINERQNALKDNNKKNHSDDPKKGFSGNADSLGVYMMKK